MVAFFVNTSCTKQKTSELLKCFKINIIVSQKEVAVVEEQSIRLFWGLYKFPLVCNINVCWFFTEL